ncbi:hypothetical protein BJ917_2026 [Pseudomonas sp. WPR_5_2]|uniref:hypothetical protein n=1 Tax=Pseudomonas sp. WPR_5_2 TaxID=1907371 RepID=UPI000F0EBF03|nr:hypothetical protein [Pseudomonas sp. WPR_5_2]RKS24551.1 hypothetical protein BJ917_2026 [Pseudomonas sp. WPR_5_2]
MDKLLVFDPAPTLTQNLALATPIPLCNRSLLPMVRFGAVVLLLCLSACGSIEHTSKPAQSIDKVLLAGRGDVVLRIDRERNLENVVGKADMWGRKTKEGFSEIRFAGIEPSGVVVLYRKDVDILSNETTLTRTPMSVTSGSATTTGSGTASSMGNTTLVSGRAQTTASSTTVSSGTDYHLAIPGDTVAIRLAPGEKRLPVSGYVIEVLAASANSLEYRVTQNGQ